MNQKERRKAYSKAYRLAHKKEIADKQKAYRLAGGESDKKYRLAHKESIKAYRVAHKKERKAYLIAHKKEIAARRKAYYIAHKKEILDWTKDYNLAHKKGIAKQRKAHYLSHTKELTERSRAYHQKNPEKGKARRRKRRALLRGNNHEPYTTNYVFERDGWVCQLCGRKINRRLKFPNPRSKSIDHIVPLSKGGNDSPTNVQATHLRCNVGKNATNKGQLRLFGWEAKDGTKANRT